MARHVTGGAYLVHGAAIVSAVPLTASVWFRPDTVNTVKTLLDIGGAIDVSRHGFVLLLVNAELRVYQQAGSFAYAAASGSVSASTWQHAAGVWRTTSDRSAYLNGGGRGNNTALVGSVFVQRAMLGQRANLLDGQPMAGALAEAGVWNTDLSDEEIAMLGKGFSPLLIRPQSLIAYWPLVSRASPEIDPRGGYGLTFSGTPTVADHPRVHTPAG